jgi:pyruvate kinase
LEKDQTLEISKLLSKLATDYTYEGDNQMIACSYEHLCSTVKLGGKLLIADGNIVCTVTEIGEVINFLTH